MKLNNGFWEDEKHNRWSAVLCSKEEALKYSATLIDCSDCRDCSYCSDCRGCKDCNYCNIFEDNPQRIIGKRMGSRDGYPSVYWIEAGKEQCVVGCFRGTLNDLERAVEKTHKYNPEYLKQYRKFIKAVRAYQGGMK